jgi:hypothetical protein
LRIYVAGPYDPRGETTHSAPRIANQNVLRAIRIGIELMKLGHNPYIPHLTHYLHIESDVEFSWERWVENDSEWLERCEALYFIAPSKGATAELEFAKKKGIHVFYNLSEVPRK